MSKYSLSAGSAIASPAALKRASRHWKKPQSPAHTTPMTARILSLLVSLVGGTTIGTSVTSRAARGAPATSPDFRAGIEGTPGKAWEIDGICRAGPEVGRVSPPILGIVAFGRSTTVAS